MTTNKTNDGKDKPSLEVVQAGVYPGSTSTESKQNTLAPTADSESVILEAELEGRIDSEGEIARRESIELETESISRDRGKSILDKLKANTAAALVGSAVMLPILGIGTATYHLGSQTVVKQAILAKRSNNIDLVEGELARQQKLLTALLIGTGATALLAGAIATLITKKQLDLLSKRSRGEIILDKSQVDGQLINSLSQSVSQKEVLKSIVEEARSYLNCDRVVVYSLNQDKYGTIVAESVALGYTKWLGITIEDPCFAARYFEQYRNGRVKAIDNLDKAEMTPCHREQLEAMEVKANLVTPIVHEGNLFGLLVAHQCREPRQWQGKEIEFLRQTGKKTGLALKNAQLTEDLACLETKAETERKWTGYFTDAIQYIRASIKQDDVLEIGVEEVRRVLECDRVVVYSLNPDNNYGVVISESVAPGYTRALHKTIEDPCFQARYLDKYRDGRVRALDNIYEAGMTKCYLEQLETLEVKANLVTPILNEGKLFGLLVAHQCSAPRHWQDYEIRWVTQIATQVGFALDNAKLLAASATTQIEATRERQWTGYFTDAIGHIRASIKQDDVLEISVEEVRRVLECDRVVVYSLNPENNYGVVISESVAPGYTRALHKTIEDPCFQARYLDKYRDGRVRALDNIYEAGMTKCYLEQLETLEVKANLVTPILNEGKLFGLLVAHQCKKPRHWQDYEIRWVTQIATQVGFALDNAKLLAASATTQIEATRERQWTDYFTDAIQYIRASIKQDDVLEISVEEVRRVLECDRVVVYSLNPDNNYGVVISESVAPGYTRALQKTIEDPCFQARYLDKYRDGRVRALDNIYEAGMTKCYLEQLETLEVKANLVTPILNEGKLFGLLVAHQCSAPRHWQDYEIRWVTQIATQVGFALDNASLLQRSQETNLPTQLLNQFSLGLKERVSRGELLSIAVEQARKVIGVDRAIVYQFDNDLNGNIVAESVIPGYPRALNSQIKDPCFAREYGEKYRQGRTKAIENVYRANLTSCHLEQLESLSVKASLVVPILKNQELFGLLIGHQCEKPRQWSPLDIDLFTQMALQLGLALDRAELREQLIAQDIRVRQVPRQPEAPNFNHELSQLLQENQAALRTLRAKIDSRTTNDAPPQPLYYRDSSQSKSQMDAIAAQRAIAEAAKKVEMLDHSHQNLHQIVDLIDNLQSKTPPQLPMGEIAIESSEIILEPTDSYLGNFEEIVEPADNANTTPNPLLMNQFIGDITDLSDKISQQSLIVTDSFQKLAEFAKQLSERQE